MSAVGDVKLRVLYVLRYFPTLTETFVYREIRGLRDRGVTVSIAAIGERVDGALQEAVPVHRVFRPASGLGGCFALFGLVPILLSARGWSSFAWARRQVGWRRALKFLQLATHARRYDRVHVHFAGEAAEVAYVAERLWGTPYTVTTHAVDLFKPRPSLIDVLTRAQAVVAISEHNARWLAEKCGVDAALVRCGVEPAKNEPAPAAEVAGERLEVLAVGRWMPKKGFDLLVEAVEGLDADVRLTLVSDAPSDLASERVKVRGLLAPSALVAEYRAADLVALPCRRAPDGDMDGVPVVLMEALAYERPVVTCPVSGVSELVDESVGWLVPPDDVDALRAALCEATDPVERRRRASMGPARLQERGFTLDAQVDGLLRLWSAR